VTHILVRATGRLLTVYMLLILLRWLGPFLQFDLDSPRWRWIPRLTDPLINRMRQLLPSMGPMDFGPIAALCLVWFARFLSWNLLLNMTSGR